MGGAQRPAENHAGIVALFLRRAAHLRARRKTPRPGAAALWLWIRRRDWPGTGLHFTGEHSGEMVSRPAWHGHGHGDHGIWRRCADWLAAGHGADGSL